MQSYAARYTSFCPPPRPKSSSRVAHLALKWPHPTSFLATPTSLAAAGFYFNPSDTTPDAVSCFICDKGLADWDPDDDPAQIHAEKCPKCPWAMLSCVTDLNDHGRITFASPSRLPSSRTMEKARLATFGPEGKRWWPHDAKNRGPTSKMMAKAGFIYSPASNKDDTCTCIYCGIELSGWQPEDDPMEEHRSRQVKNGPCPFFTEYESFSTATKRARSKSKAPPTAPAVSSSDEEYHPPSAKSSRNVSSTKRPASSSGRTKLLAKSSRNVTKVKTPASEVVAEYEVALSDDQHAPSNPRSKSRRTGTRSSSRASNRGTSTGESEIAPSFTKKPHSPKPTPMQYHKESEPERTKVKNKTKAVIKSPKSGDNSQVIRDQRQELSSNSQPDSSKIKPNAPMPAIPFDLTSFQTVEDEDFAREEQALDDQARELMLADATLKAVPAPFDRGNQSPEEYLAQELFHSPRSDSGTSKVLMSIGDSRGDTFLTLSAPRLHVTPTVGVTRPLGSKSLQPFSQELVASMTDKERAMTVEQWIRHEMNCQYERLKSDGQQKIDAFKLRAIDVAKQIERL